MKDEYPPYFWENVEKLKAGDHSVAGAMLDFLEEDPYFFRSGYAKEKVLHYLKRVIVGVDEKELSRMKGVVLQVVDRHYCREFRYYRRLALRIMDDDMRSALDRRLEGDDLNIRKRAAFIIR